MGNELTEKKKENITVFQLEKGLNEIIKPLVKEIRLFDTYVAGTTYSADPQVLQKIAPGDRLVLRREESKFDELAILVLTAEHEKIGYIPEKDNAVFARLMDAGKRLIARVSSVKPQTGFTEISITIFLEDF